MKKIIIFGLFCVSLMILGCGDSGNSGKTTDNGNDSGREMGSLYGECYPNETCDKGLECDVENNICIKESENSENSDDTDTTSENKEDKTDTDSEISDNESDSTTDSMSDDKTEDSTNNDDDANNDDDNGCTTGAYKCKDSNSYFCKGDLWTFEKYCEYGCDSATGKCKTTECSGNEYTCYYEYTSRHCENGHWKTESCEGGCDQTTGKCRDFCYNITGKTWSRKAETKKNWEEALDYCDKLTACGHSDWHLPTISELRTLVQNCPAIETGGKCGVTDDCLSYPECWTENCSMCSSDSNDYSKIDDFSICLWSSSVVHDNYTEAAWNIYFFSTFVDLSSASSNLANDVRCVRNAN
ncbi:DUF1566 domain-containing protein [bacterium]|nr:DUF1566 domain-containing protein [bacterium]